MLTLEGVRVAQGDFTLSADLTVSQRALIAVTGPSGAGKSTLLGVIAGFVQPEAGKVILDNQDITQLAPGHRPVATLFQDSNLFPHLTAAQNVGLGLRPSLKLRPAEHDKVVNAMDRVGLSGLGDRKPGALSGGQQSRVALARVLLQNAPLVLLDEPFAALGPALKLEVLDLVAEIARERALTVIMVTHHPQDAKRIADQTILVAEGIAHPPIETKTLFAAPPPALRAYLGSEK